MTTNHFEVEPAVTRPTVKEEAERLLSFWERHGSSPEVVTKWAVLDMLGILRYIVEDEA